MAVAHQEEQLGSGSVALVHAIKIYTAVCFIVVVSSDVKR